MVEILRNKNLATKFQILAELANGGQHIQQRTVADNLGITPQAVSEYIKQLIQDGYVSQESHSRLRLTTQGVNWIIQELRSLKEYSDFVVKSISDISECAAIAESDLEKNQAVGLVMKEGLLWASPNAESDCKGMTCGGARAGEEVGVRNIQGIVYLKPGQVSLLIMPSVQKGGSSQVDGAVLNKLIGNKQPVCALGIEALVALRKTYAGEFSFFGATAIVIEAAQHGLNPAIVCVDNETASLVKKMEEMRVQYNVVEIPTKK